MVIVIGYLQKFTFCHSGESRNQVFLIIKKRGLRINTPASPSTSCSAESIASRVSLPRRIAADIRLALVQVQPLGSERFSEIMCAAAGVRRAQKRPGRPMVKHGQSARVEEQGEFGKLNTTEHS